ncbi:hypothetical protein J4E86_009968 [Alternaria arbusti]|uniref:uncharacterized protein n=1 Tax=Alternaria arbusti TaxID=232088 RepID=UPI00221ED755|nr:uncharacterized protein J4E86_009968 [Alternaria arbusti]KAI4943021.1 hypothetical protein J4E86_009968 [Alternaria arbusti]
MDSVELEEPYDEEGNFSYGHSQDDLDNDYTGSGDEQSGEDRYANSESNESDEAPDDASANDTEGELSDSVISEDLSMSASDDDEEDEDEEDGELETGSMESDVSGSDQEDDEEVNDTESDVSGSDQGDDEEVNDTESDDISSDSEAVSIEEEIIDPVSEESGSDSEADDLIGEGAGENTTVESMGSSVTASHVPSKKKRKPTVLEMEGSAIQVPANTKQQFNSKASGTKSSKNDAIRSHPRPPPVSFSDTEETWIPTSFSNPPKVFLNGIFAGVMMQRRKSTTSVFDHASHAIIGFSMSKEQGKRYEEAGMKKYKAAKDGFTLWWKPYTPSADYFDRADEVE